MKTPTFHNNLPWGKVLRHLILFGLLGLVLIPFLDPTLPPTDRHKTLEARFNVSGMNRHQQKHFFTDNTFAESVNDFKIGIPLETQNYRYSTNALDNTAFQYGISLHPEEFKLQPKIWGIFPRKDQEYALPSYLGVVWIKPNLNSDFDETQSDVQMFSILCKSTYPYLLEEGFQPSSQNGDFHCPEGMKLVER